MKKQITIGTRGSKLAEIQARWVLAKLASLYPETEFCLAMVVPIGDRKKSSPIGKIPARGVFVKELQKELLMGKIDMAVHSLKDLPLHSPKGLSLAAVTKRLDPRDVLVSRGERLKELASNSVVGTGSVRRERQLHAFRSDLQVRKIRGNIDTRLRLVSRREVDGIIVAAAGLIRLGWEDKITEILSVEHFLPEPGQGALALETRADDREVSALVKPLHHESTWKCVVAERAFAMALGAGCSAPVASLGTVNGTILRLRGMAAGPRGLLYASEEGSVDSLRQVAERLVNQLLERGAIRATVRS